MKKFLFVLGCVFVGVSFAGCPRVRSGRDFLRMVLLVQNWPLAYERSFTGA